MYLTHQTQWQYVLASSPAWRAAAHLEKRLCGHFDKRYAIAVGDVHQALLAVALATDIQPGDEVIVSPIEARGVAALALRGATLVPGILRSPDLLIDDIWLHDLLSERTRMVVVPNTGGVVVDHDAIRRGLDAAHAVLVVGLTSLGANDERGMPSGADADLIIVDLGHGKAITAGQGAVIVLDDRSLYERLLRAVAPTERQWHELGDASPCNLNSTLPASASLMLHNTWHHQWDRLRDKQRRYAKALSTLDKDFITWPFSRAGGCSFEHAWLCLRPRGSSSAERCTLRYLHEEPGPHMPGIRWHVHSRTTTMLGVLKRQYHHVRAENLIAEKWLYC